MNIEIKPIYAPKEVEKLVLPSIIYASQRNDLMRVSVISFGWWHWALQVVITKLINKDKLINIKSNKDEQKRSILT